MGEVYLAQDIQLGRRVALKFLPAELTKDTDLVHRFKQEARAASALNHPNIVTIHEIGQAEGRHFIVTEFIVGETLRQRIRSSQPHVIGVANPSVMVSMSIGEVLKIGMQIADALAAAHSTRIIHRDIKPENIILVRDDHQFQKDILVKLIDFGIAKLTTAEQGENSESTTRMLVNTHEGTAIGTTHYMSPEQARGEEVDARTDIWSLGVVLYEMLSSRQPFNGETVQDELASILKDEAPPLPPEIPRRIRSIIGKALRKNRDERYQTMKDLYLDLAAVARELDGKLIKLRVPVQIGSANDQKTTSHVSRRNVLIGIVALLVVTLTLGGYLYFKYFSGSARVESLAVARFVNASGERDLEYLSNGMTDILVSSLKKLPELSVFRYQGKEIEPREVAQESAAQAVLTGRIVQRGDELVLSLRLVDGHSGNNIWNKDYTRNRKDLASLQKEIAQDVSRKLRVGISDAEEQRVTKGYTDDTEAYQLFLKGHSQVFKLQLEEIQNSLSSFEQAIQIDPTYALAYVGLAEANCSLAVAAEMSPAEFLLKSRGAAQKAIDIDNNSVEAHVALGRAMFWYWDWSDSEQEYRKALALDPNNANAHQYYAHLLSNTGRHQEAIAEIRRAKQLKEYDPFADALEGLFLIHAGEPDRALASLRNTIKLAPNFWIPHAFAAAAYIDKGMFEEALIEASRARELNGMQTRSLVLESYALAKLERRAEAEAKLDELLKLSKHRFVPPYFIALVYNGLGNRNQTLIWLDRAFELHDPRLAFLRVDRLFANLQNDQQFNDLRLRLGFPQ